MIRLVTIEGRYVEEYDSDNTIQKASSDEDYVMDNEENYLCGMISCY
ncbi:MAG: hypothetical protein AAF621_06975 [Pseudomonadota bacterium]